MIHDLLESVRQSRNSYENQMVFVEKDLQKGLRYVMEYRVWKDYLSGNWRFSLVEMTI